VDGSESLSVGIGVDAGEPVTEHNDLFGTTVQLASRLCHEAEADGILVSRAVRELCEDAAAQFAPLGERQLKGFAEKTPVFRFEWRR
jgi:class 3 adenylate cyclase